MKTDTVVTFKAIKKYVYAVVSDDRNMNTFQMYLSENVFPKIKDRSGLLVQNLHEICVNTLSKTNVYSRLKDLAEQVYAHDKVLQNDYLPMQWLHEVTIFLENTIANRIISFCSMYQGFTFSYDVFYDEYNLDSVSSYYDFKHSIVYFSK